MPNDLSVIFYTSKGDLEFWQSVGKVDENLHDSFLCFVAFVPYFIAFHTGYLLIQVVGNDMLYTPYNSCADTD